MAIVQIPIAGARQVDRAFSVNAQRAIGWYPEVEGDGAKSILTMKPTPGLRELAQAGNGPRRSHGVDFEGDHYFVSGGNLVKVSPLWVATIIGALNTNAGWCGIIAGRTHLLVVDGGDGYTWDGTTFAVVADPDFPVSPSACGYMDGYFIVNDDATDQFSISANEDPTAWDALDFASAEADPDNAVAIATSYRDLYLIGQQTTQVYFNSSNADFPFDLYANGVLEFGSPAPASVVRAGGNIFMVAASKNSSVSIVRLNGFQAQKIVDPEMAYTLGRMATITDAVGMAYTQDDQTFYEITFPTEGITYTYHLEQDMWHERSSGGIGLTHRALGHGYFNREHVVGDNANGIIYALDPETYTDNGAPIWRRRIASILHREGRQIEINGLEVEFKAGVGTLAGQGRDPQAMLRYSFDGGHTWSRELWQRIGRMGQYGQRACWTRLGQGHHFLLEITVTDPVEAIIVGAYADVAVLDA
jgi:hypothetical protein